MNPWLTFAVSAVLIVIAGTKLAHYGDRIAEATGLGRLWIGVVLLAAATSLPEVFTTVSAAMIDAPDLAAGDLFGAGLTNMLTLGLIDLVHRQRRVWQQAALGHTLVAVLAMVLTALAGLLVLTKAEVGVAGIGVGSGLLLVIYLLGMRVVFRQEDLERRQREEEKIVAAEDADHHRHALKGAVLGFALSAAAVVGAAPFLAASAHTIALITGMEESFVGTSLLAITTSLPELTTAFAAVRLGAFDLAVGNLFGSNAFNMAAFFFADAAYRPGSLFGAVAHVHALTAFLSIVLMSIGIMGIIYRAERRFLLLEPDSLLMILGYALAMMLLFR